MRRRRRRLVDIDTNQSGIDRRRRPKTACSIIYVFVLEPSQSINNIDVFAPFYVLLGDRLTG